MVVLTHLVLAAQAAQAVAAQAVPVAALLERLAQQIPAAAAAVVVMVLVHQAAETVDQEL